MKVSECMTRDVRLTDPDATLQAAARLMAELDVGVLPVGENDRLIGMLTDRDIAVRAVAQGKGPDMKVRDAMTSDICYCFEDEDGEHVLANMGDNQVRRMPVLDRNKRLVGIVSLSDLALDLRRDQLGHTFSQISQPGGQHSQTTH